MLLAKVLLAALFFAFSGAASLAGELSPKGRVTVKEVGFDPDSPLVRSIADDVIIYHGDPTKLDEFASKGMKNATYRFILMRTFLRDYQKNPRAQPPAGDDWRPDFLSAEEVALIKPVMDQKAKESSKRILELMKKKP